ncbi:uncharacterized protein FOMMEDRAFT_153584 [Fomitiporia mediterranea MF3/22]|uniref:uncharacterized protein n=1 Tax=Fomitiporia mediterranea (strain MF3/22) TaxID=694068 RepID=UPI00044085A4|nr:uncharacterized protein FOMMEDRAFT_153584 [Fomitiporia mediterranea MF3/22]EJD06185.1 hypothetical protein FOMMEDRAFT_153584 [Fomitiporia mediterranea MF3/22]
MDMLMAQPDVADPKHTSTTVIYGAKYQFGLHARQAVEASAGAGGACNEDLPSGATVSTECETKKPLANAFSVSADSHHDPVTLDTSNRTTITTSPLPSASLITPSVVFDPPPAISPTLITTPAVSVTVFVTSPNSHLEPLPDLRASSTSNTISSITDANGPPSTTHFNAASSVISSATKNVAFSTITTSLSSGISTGTSSGSNSSLHPVLSKGETLGIFVGVGFAIVIAAISALCVFRRVRASKSNTSPPLSNPIIDDTHTIRSRNAGSIDPYRIEEYLRTSWHEDVATLRKFNMNGP